MVNETYIVQEGDTIISVAQLFGIKVIDLIRANQLEDVYYLTPGEELIVPTQTPLGFTYYIVQKGDTLYSIAKTHDITLQDLITINGLEDQQYIYPGQKILIPKDGVKAYITQEGDTLSTVAELLKIPAEDILVYNQRIYLLPEQLIAYKIKEN